MLAMTAVVVYYTFKMCL